MRAIAVNMARVTTVSHGNGGRMTSSSYNNGVSESRGYNTDNTLASITFSGASIGNMTYSWDSNKNKTAEEITGTMSDYGFTIPSGGYDEEDRLVSYNRTAGLTQSWDLSLVGDWNSVTTNSNTQNRTHGPAHEILTVASQNVIHEYKGNTTLIPAAARGNTLDLVVLWDFDNRMQLATEVQFGKPVISHKYDALGRRVARAEDTTTTVFVQVGHQTICDYPSGGTPAQSIYHYLYASYIDEPVMRWETAEDEAVYYHRNQQYSVVAITDDSGAIVERYSYTAYGEPAFFNGAGTIISGSAYGNRYTYTGREWDGFIKLYHYRARMYDPQLGRFLGRDPIGYVDSVNPYRISIGLANVDPSGLLTKTFRFVAKSFINGVVPIGTISPDRPGGPFPWSLVSPVGPTATDRLNFIAQNLFTHLPAFNENPMQDSKDGRYRLFTRVEPTVKCCGNIPNLVGLVTDRDGGLEGVPPPKAREMFPFLPDLPVYGTINFSPLTVVNSGAAGLAILWRGWGRPNLLAEPAMQWVAFRASLHIWHYPSVLIKCQNGVPYVANASFGGGLTGASKFPSHRLWLDGNVISFKMQRNLSDLWYSHSIWPTFVH